MEGLLSTGHTPSSLSMRNFWVSILLSAFTLLGKFSIRFGSFISVDVVNSNSTYNYITLHRIIMLTNCRFKAEFLPLSLLISLSWKYLINPSESVNKPF